MPFRVIFLWAAITTLATTGFAQKSGTDSLVSRFLSMRPDTSKVNLLNRVVDSLRDKNNNLALFFAQQAKDLAASLEYKPGLGHALENLGWTLYRRGDFSKSLAVSTDALHVNETLKDTAAIARSLMNIAAIHHEQKQYNQAIISFRKAYHAAKAIDEYYLVARGLINIGYTFLGLDQLDSAFFYTQKALAVSETAGNPNVAAFARRTLGDIYLAQDNSTDALRNFNICLDIAVKNSNTFIRTSVLHRLGRTHSMLGNYNRAEAYLTENIRVASLYGFKDELERSYRLLSELYFKQKDLARAYACQSAYISLHDSLNSQRSKEQIALMQIRFDTEIKQAQIELLTKDAALQAEQIDQQRVWIYFYVGCLSLLIILAFVLFYNNRYNKKAKKDLEEKNRAIESQAEELRNLNVTKDKLLSIIGHDLRSPVGSLRVIMEMLDGEGLTRQEFIDVTKNLRRNLDSVYDDLDNLLLWAQTQLNGLQAVPEDFDLRKLADEKFVLFDDLARNKNITMVNDIHPDTMVFADRNHVSLIFRNLIANAVKFNPPGGMIVLAAVEHADYYEICVTDTGIGMSHDDINRLFRAETHFTKLGTNQEKGVGIGLLLTKEFVETNQGSISVSSEMGKGTSFRFTLRTSKQAVLI